MFFSTPSRKVFHNKLFNHFETKLFFHSHCTELQMGMIAMFAVVQGQVYF